MANISLIPKLMSKLGINTYLILSIFDFKCKIINQNVVINGSDITDTNDKVWIVQNGKYLTYPKIDCEQTWNFSLILSIFDFKCKILDQNATINGRDIINTNVKVQIVKNGKYLTYPKLIASKLGISLQLCRYLTLNVKL